jgi:hypothetical protein
MQAARIVDPTEAIVIDPPCGGVDGKSERPRSKRICDIGTPSTSAATCVMDV